MFHWSESFEDRLSRVYSDNQFKFDHSHTKLIVIPVWVEKLKGKAQNNDIFFTWLARWTR